jgi:pimeloyl-ACP methyl ester carboxylesterase
MSSPNEPIPPPTYGYNFDTPAPTNGKVVKVRHDGDTLDGLDIELYCETIGDKANPALLCVDGLGMDCSTYDIEWCNILATHFYVIRFDNRDVGMSTKVECPAPALYKFLLPKCCCCCCPEAEPYPLYSMADDAVALLDVLGIEKAHIMGYSMGGMIAQLVGIRHPDRCLSLTCIMTMTGNRAIQDPSFGVQLELIKQPKSGSLEDMMAFRLHFEGKVCATGENPPSEDDRRRRAMRGFDRSTYDKGKANQSVAIVAAPARDEALKKVTLPTIVVHGEKDILVPPANGRHLAKCLPNARLVVLPRMGHYISPAEWPVITQLLVDVNEAVVSGTADRWHEAGPSR